MRRFDRRSVLSGSIAVAGAALPSALLPRAAAATRNPATNCDLDLSSAAIDSAAEWDAAYESRWGRLGPQSRRQIDVMVHNKDGVYDDSDGVFAWIVRYWIRAWVAMADLTGNRKYTDCCVSCIDFMVDHTDRRRVLRGEITENYLRDPLYFRGTGQGGPFWKRGRDVIALNTGQISHGILRFVDAVYADKTRWSAYVKTANRYFAQVRITVDAFDNDWQVFADKGSYHSAMPTAAGNSASPGRPSISRQP